MKAPIATGHGDACRKPLAGERSGGWLRARFGGSRAYGLLKRGYEAGLLLRTGGRGLACTLPGGETLRILPAYRHTRWNLAEYEAFRAALAPGGVALDVGANVGAYTLLFAQWVGENGRVYAFEPSPEIVRGLERHVSLNRVASRVEVVPAAVTDRTATASFVAAGLHAINRLAATGEPAAASDVVVATSTLDAFCERRRIAPTLVKIDVEGFELAALRGARETIRAGAGRLALFVEMHPSLWPSLGISRDEVAAEIDRQGLVAEPLRPDMDVWTLEGVCVRLRYK